MWPRHSGLICLVGLADASSLDIKHSTFKNVKSFLKTVAKEGIVKVKEAKGDIVVMGEPTSSIFLDIACMFLTHLR